MSRFNTWISLRNRRQAGGRRTRAQNFCRALHFECCEPRIALSTNALGLWTLTASAQPEGGFIEFGSTVSYDGLSGAFPQGASTDSESVIPFGGVPRTSGLHVSAGGVQGTHDIVPSDLSPPGNNVRLIAPIVGQQHPEGGQIALINLPAGVVNGLAAVPLHAAAKVAREPIPAVQGDVGTRLFNEAGGLRSRAIAFEVANVQPADRQAGAVERSGMPRLSPELAAFGRESSEVSVQSERRDALSELHAGTDARPQQNHHGKPEQLADTQPAPKPTFTAHAIKLAAADSEHPVECPHGGTDLDGAHAASDLAWTEFGQDEAAPIDDSVSALVEGRGRRVLALALALTVGSAPLGRLLRRGTPQKAIEQRPPRRRWHKLF